jgi:uncharacterized membrane protein YgaE (UPF0421/DUF939 family)
MPSLPQPKSAKEAFGQLLGTIGGGMGAVSLLLIGGTLWRVVGVVGLVVVVAAAIRATRWLIATGRKP